MAQIPLGFIYKYFEKRGKGIVAKLMLPAIILGVLGWITELITNNGWFMLLCIPILIYVLILPWVAILGSMK